MTDCVHDGNRNRTKLSLSFRFYRLVNGLKPDSIRKVNESQMAFKCMENINNFLTKVTELGVPSQEQFQTVDLWERQNLNSVVICLQSLGRKAPNFGKPGIGPKEAS